MSGLTVEQLSQEELVKLIDAVQHGLACAYEDRIVIALKMALAALSERGGEAVAYRYRMHPNFHWTLSYRFPVVPNNVEVQPLYTCPQAGQVSENAAQGAENGSGTPANIAGLGNPPAAAPACPDGADTLLRKAVGDVERIPEYFQKPGIVEKLSEVHPVLLVRQMAHEILRLRAHLSGKDRT